MIEEIFTTSKNPERAKALLEMAQDRLDDILNENKTYKIIEQYYEIIKELITSLMYANGFKTLSHRALIEFLEKHYNQFFTREQFILIDELRRLRNNIMYYGKIIDSIFIKNKEPMIKIIIGKLFGVCRKEI